VDEYGETNREKLDLRNSLWTETWTMVRTGRRRHGGDVLVAGYLGGEEDADGAEFVEEGPSLVLRGCACR
jgi:hypothetical protein